MAGEHGGTSEATLEAIPLVVASEPPVEIEPRPWYARIVVPRVVDYLIVAAFMFFWL